MSAGLARLDTQVDSSVEDKTQVMSRGVKMERGL